MSSDTSGLAIINGTLAAAVGLGLQQWVAGVLLWAVGHSAAVMAARRDPDFAPVLLRHIRQKGYPSIARSRSPTFLGSTIAA